MSQAFNAGQKSFCEQTVRISAMKAKDRFAIELGCNYYNRAHLGLKYEYIFRPNARLGLSAYNLVHQTEIKSAQSSKGKNSHEIH